MEGFSSLTSLLQTNLVCFIGILEEYVITELYELSPNDLHELVVTSIKMVGEDRPQVLLACASLYFSYCLLKGPIAGTPTPT